MQDCFLLIGFFSLGEVFLNTVVSKVISRPNFKAVRKKKKCGAVFSLWFCIILTAF